VRKINLDLSFFYFNHQKKQKRFMQIPKLKVLVEAGVVRQVEAMPEADGWAVCVED
jgi:hypothetical protein